MPPRAGTRTEPSRVHERPPDPAEASRTPLEPKQSADPHGQPPPRDPHGQLSNPAHDPDPTADSDPYLREPADRQIDPPLIDAQDELDADPEMRRSAMQSLRTAAGE